MMIRWTAGLALLVAVLAPMQASAACAWVLWDADNEQKVWQAHDVLETRATCIKALDKLVEKFGAYTVRTSEARVDYQDPLSKRASW